VPERAGGANTICFLLFSICGISIVCGGAADAADLSANILTVGQSVDGVVFILFSGSSNNNKLNK